MNNGTTALTLNIKLVTNSFPPQYSSVLERAVSEHLVITKASTIVDVILSYADCSCYKNAKIMKKVVEHDICQDISRNAKAQPRAFLICVAPYAQHRKMCTMLCIENLCGKPIKIIL